MPLSRNELNIKAPLTQNLSIPDHQINADQDPVILKQNHVDDEASFLATFVDGSSFRNMIEYIRLPTIEGVFRFTKTNIFYEQADPDKNILNIVNIKSYELTEYSFESKTDEIVVGINLVELRNITRNVGKKDHIDLYKLPEEPKSLYIRVRSQSEKGSDSNLYRLPIITTNYLLYTLPEYKRGKRDPTCTIYQSDFSKLCKSLVAIKCNKVKIHSFKHGLICKGISNTGEIASVKEFGKCRENTNPSTNLKSIYPTGGRIIRPKVPPPRLKIGEIGEIESFTIDKTIIKFLIKLNALSPNGTIKVYVEKDLPLKMVCNIGTFGKMSIYLMG